MAAPARLLVLAAPATSGALQVLRAVASGVAARMEFPFDVVDELRIAVSEAGSLLLGVGGSTLHLEIDPSAPRFEALIWTDADAGGWDGEDLEASFAWTVIEGLCDEASRAVHDGGPAILLVRRRPGTDGS